MPRRKRTTSQNEGRRKVRRTDDEEETLVISDSENDEEEDAVIRKSSRESRWRERDNRSQMQDMTEDEMLDLAMRLSKQEANSAAQRQQLEDDHMKKAIAESLHVSRSQAYTDSPSSMSKPSQDPATVTTKLRSKLTFVSKSEINKARDEVAAAAQSDEESTQDLSPFPPMPDLSQSTLSQLSPPSPALTPVPSTASQECYSSQWKSQFSQVFEVASPVHEHSQSNSQTQSSPTFLRNCSVRLTQHPMSTVKTSRNPLTMQDSFTSTGNSQLTQQQSQSPPKSPVFVKTDPKRGAPEDNLTDTVCTPKEEKNEESATHQNKLHGRNNPRKSVPDDEDGSKKQEDVQLNQLKDDCTLGTSLNAILEQVPNSEEVPLHADNKSLEEFTSHMVLHLDDDDDDDDDDDGGEEEKVVAASPVFHHEFVPHADNPRLSPTQPCCSPPTAITSEDNTHRHSHSTKDLDSHHACIRKKFTFKTTYPAATDQLEFDVRKTACDTRPIHLTEEKGNNLVSYYWGVPFCPRGQSPDDYTRVILSQLEVYEKSLKEAQHQLLDKAEWGLPLLPCPVERPFGRRMKRHRAPQLLEEEEDEPQKEEGEKKKEAEEEGEERAKPWVGSKEGAENGQNETYVVVSSPETQEELVHKSPLLFRQHESTDMVRPSSYRKCTSQDLSEDSRIQQPDEHEVQKENVTESTVCPETQMTEDNTPELMVTSPAQAQSRAESEVMEVDEEATVDERMDQDQPQSQRVECPMCTRFFPINKIEVHAAYCDGTTEDQEQDNFSQVLTLRKRTRKIALEGSLSRSENRSEQQEKCYLCHKFFPSKEYSHHVDKCLQKESRSNQGNGLLSALHRAENVHLDDDHDDDGAGPSDLIKNHGGLADSLVLTEDVGNKDSPAPSFYVCSSPIKSFTPISEATDCLIDFQHQYSTRPHHRLGRKRKYKR